MNIQIVTPQQQSALTGNDITADRYRAILCRLGHRVRVTTAYDGAPCDVLVAPAQLALRLDELDLATRLPSLRNVIGLWRTPEQVGSSASWSAKQATLTDVYLFGEAGLFGARRTAEDGSAADTVRKIHAAVLEACAGDLDDDATAVCLAVS